MTLPERKQTRLKEYDYSTPGAYHIVLCTHNKQKILWKNCRVDPCGRPQIEYSKLGEIAKDTISIIEKKYGVSIDKYVVMPDHVHFLITLPCPEERLTARVNPTMDRLIGAYKSIVSNEWLKICKQKNIIMGKLWQRSYFDHVIRNRQDYEETWNYIESNPHRWIEKYNL